MALERQHPDSSLQTAETVPTSNPILAVLRRWPLLLVGVAIGLVIGAMLYVASAPQYQSSAQLLVVKKRTDVVQGGDVRVGVLEDYIATQVTLVKSEKIRKAAVKEARTANLSVPLPDDEIVAADVIRGGLNVVRDKDTSSNTVGSGILILTYRGSHPQDTKRLLDSIIKAYQRELYALFDQASRERAETLTTTINSYESQRKIADTQRLEGLKQLRDITTENVPGISSRITAQKDKLYAIQLELIDLTEQLELIKRAGNNRSERLAVLAQLTAMSRAGSLTETSPAETLLRQSEAQRKELTAELGKDNPRVKALDAQIEFYRDEIRRLNPDLGLNPLDELGALGKRLEQRKKTSELQKRQLEARLVEDEGYVKRAGEVQDRVDEAIARVKQIDTEIGRLNVERSAVLATQGSTGFSAEPITPPADGGKVAPVLMQSLALGLAIGLLLGGGAVVVAELTDRSFKSPAEIQRRLGVPVIGHVPQIRLNIPAEPGTPVGMEPVLVTALRPKSAEAEAYRGVRTAIAFTTQGKGPQLLQVTSPNPGDGKSTLAANLAISLAQSGKRVVIIDADFRKPRIHRLFNLPNSSVGLASVVGGQSLLASAVRPQVVPNLDIIPCGDRPSNPAELLTSPQFHDVLQELKSRYDYVLVDTPPILAVSDPAVVATQVDGVILVFRMTKDARPVAERTREQLAALGAKILGVVVNGWSRGQGYADYNYGGAGYRYSDYHYSDAETEDDKDKD